MPTRRKLLTDTLTIGAGLALAGPLLRDAPAAAAISDLQRNAAVVRRFKTAQGTKDEADATREVLSPSYKRWRGGIEHLAANARDQGFPGPGSYLRGAFPDRAARTLSSRWRSSGTFRIWIILLMSVACFHVHYMSTGQLRDQRPLSQRTCPSSSSSTSTAAAAPASSPVASVTCSTVVPSVTASYTRPR